MEDKIKNFVYDTFEMETDTEYQFKKLHELTFVFKNDVILIRKRISSNSLTPVGIIYEENGEYYLAPLDKNVSISDVVREYVRKCLKWNYSGRGIFSLSTTTSTIKGPVKSLSKINSKSSIESTLTASIP